MLKYAFAATVSALITTPAVAADLAGPRIEGRVSYDRISLDMAISDGLTTERFSGHDKGPGYGVEAGYDARLGATLVIGAYAGIERSTTKECAYAATERLCARLGRNITAGGRLGMIASPTVLFYAKGGYSNGRLSVDYRDTAFPGDNVDVGVNRDGFHVGLGAEGNVGSKGYIKAEYVRTNYRDAGVRDGANSFGIDSHRDQAVVGLGMRF
jgi:outer membrane immunogenic protein